MNSLKGIPIVLILTCVIIGLCALSGFISGFVRKISGLVSFILACILVSIFLPTITSGLRTTPIYTAIRNRCEVIGNNIVKNVVVQSLGSDGAAGIGGGKVSDYCELEISGGNITAIGDGSGPGIGRGRTTAGDSSQSSSKKVLINITGGEVTASSNNGGAGIGVGEGTIFNGKINISGGKVTATGRNGGAGIGTGATTIDGEKAFMYGWIIISGGEIIAKGEFDKDAHYDPEVYKPGCGAGIGSGSAGEKP